MKNIPEKIRMQIGEGEIATAIETANEHLKTVGGKLYNNAIHLKGRFNDYLNNHDLGMEDPKEKSRISMSVLNLALEIEKKMKSHVSESQSPSSVDFDQQPINPKANGNPQPASESRYIAQCLFTTDTMQYFLHQNDEIFMLNPFNNQSALVGKKMPSQNPQFAWTLLFTTTNIYYLVDHAGIIWGQDFGMPAQYGAVKYL